jgi:two-component system, response regulator PhcR
MNTTMNPVETNPEHESLPAVANCHAILMVDDEPQACKWFARLYGDEFTVLTASSVDEALALLAERGHEVAVLLTDYSMPGRNGLELLSEVRQSYGHVGRLLVSAYADKDVAIAAVNQGQVEKILEKPLDEATTRLALREALAASARRAHDRALIEHRAATLRETLGFLAHEIATPLATVSVYLSAMRERHQETLNDPQVAPDNHTESEPEVFPSVAYISQRQSGEVRRMLESAQRRADYAQSLVAIFVQTARDAYRGLALPSLRASELVGAVRDEYPFDENESRWMTYDLAADFSLPGRRDLMYLVLCTLVKNALMAMASALPLPAQPRLTLALGREAPAPGLPEQPVIRVIDNGPGIPPEVLQRLTHEPITTRARSGGNGMGVMFCHRVMLLLGGSVQVRSELGQGTTVTLYFPLAKNESVEVSP